MSTRGALIIRRGGRDIVQYVHCDSYPGGWPAQAAEWLRSAENRDRLKAAALRVVTEEGDKDAYSRLRDCQGKLGAILDSGEFLDAGVAWLADGLFCEYAYCVNLDAGLWEVYKGFKEGPFTVEEGGRYALSPDAAVPDNGYYPVRLVATFPLDNIPTEWPNVE